MSYESVLNALSDPTRRALFERLREAPCSVGELAREFPISQPAVSQHLRVLREARLVEPQREGARRIYRVSGSGLSELRAYLESFWDGVLTAFRDSNGAPKGD